MTSDSPRRARIAAAVFFFVSGFGFSSWASRIPTIQQNLHLSEGKLGAVLFALPAGLMCTLPITGNLLRRFSSRYIMMTGAVLFNIMLCLVGFAHETWQLVVLLFFFGSSRNLFNISCQCPINRRAEIVRPLYHCHLSWHLEHCRFCSRNNWLGSGFYEHSTLLAFPGSKYNY